MPSNRYGTYPFVNPNPPWLNKDAENTMKVAVEGIGELETLRPKAMPGSDMNEEGMET